MFIFAEGTTTNGQALIRFQTGGFQVPFQIEMSSPPPSKYFNLSSGRPTSPACHCALFAPPLDHLDEGPGLSGSLNFPLALSLQTYLESLHTPGSWYEVVYAPSPSNPIQNGADLQTC